MIEKMRLNIIFLICLLISYACHTKSQEGPAKEKKQDEIKTETKAEIKKSDIKPKIKVRIRKEFLYDKDTLPDNYPYKATTREFQWDKIRKKLIFLDSIQENAISWAILQNYKNFNGEAKTVKNFRRNDYNWVSDSLGVERYQSAPLYSLSDSIIPLLYGRDGSLVKLTGTDGNFIKIKTLHFEGEWKVPKRYVKTLDDSITFKKTIFVDRTNQNIATLEKIDSIWFVRSMVKATTGLHKPPYQHETPLGIFVVQQKKYKMIYNDDGSSERAGFAPYASRFSSGAHLHGVPVNGPIDSKIVESSPSLGTTPRSHMCVRTISSHAEFIYKWGKIDNAIVFVFD